MSSTPVPNHPADLLAMLASRDPTRPRLTWYDDTPGTTQGERIELSGRVLATWSAKTAGLLTEELDIAPGDVVALHLPMHWRWLYWAFGTWQAGAAIRLPGARPFTDGPLQTPAAITPHQVLVSDFPTTDSFSGDPFNGDPFSGDPLSHDDVHRVAVSLPALARSWNGPPLPPGVLDEASELPGQPDLFDPAGPVHPSDPALQVTTGTISPKSAGLIPAATDPAEAAVSPSQPAWTWTASELLDAARRFGAKLNWSPQVRAAVCVPASGGHPASDQVSPLLATVAAWLLDGSVVLTRGGDPASTERRWHDERVTGHWPTHNAHDLTHNLPHPAGS